MTFVCNKAVQLNSPGLNFDMNFYRGWRKDKLLFVMGATGTGKTRLAIDLATRVPAEIVNSDKIQVFKGLDTVTNKVTEEECRGVPHHLLGTVDPDANFTVDDFRDQATGAIESIIGNNRYPIIAGGSNSYIEALVDPKFQLRYDCCFLWVDVSLPVLYSFVSERVDRMVQMGLVDEVREIFDPSADYSRGIRRAIGVPELDEYLRAEGIVDERTRVKYLEKAVQKIKDNTCMLASRQLQKIRRLYDNWRWKMHRIDATEFFLKRGGQGSEEAWMNQVVWPSVMAVEKFLYDEEHHHRPIESPSSAVIVNPPVPVVAASR